MKIKSILKDILLLITGTGLLTLSLHMVVIPNNMGTNGLAGLSVILYRMLAINPNITFFLFNIPLLLIGYRFVGKKLFFLTIIGASSMSLWLTFWPLFPSIQMSDLGILAGIFDGILSGIGIGFAIKSGGSSGGSAIISVILNHLKNISMSKTLLSIDIVVIAAAFVTFLSFESFLITILSSVIASLLVKVIVKNDTKTIRTQTRHLSLKPISIFHK
jgi:uncharacterized membrane-anchored protein YitT (DUF2179 family)